MRTQLTFTSRDIHILRFLSLRVRIATETQIARTWWSNATKRRAVRRLDLLESAKLVRSFRQLIALPHCDEPICRWKPGDYPPDFAHIAWRLQRRVVSGPAMERVYTSTAAGARRFGGVRRNCLAHPFQLTHDLGVTEVYLTLLATRPELAELWVDEDRLARYRWRQKLPDAVIATHPAAAPLLVVEYGGNYSKHRLLAFHDDCQDRGVPYEIW